MSLLYLSALLLASLCMLLLDRRFRLFFFRDARAASVVTLVGLAFFLLWDMGGIVLGVFLLGDSPYSTGILLAPELPLEEPVFLIFLVLCTMVSYTGAAELLRHRGQRRRATPHRAERIRR